MINCVVCGKETPAGKRGHAKKYCSRQCAYPRKTATPTNCKFCDQRLDHDIRAGRPRETCGRKCRDGLRAKLSKEARQINKNCCVCDTPFRTGKKSQRFCSAECRQIQHKIDHPHQRNTEPKTLVCGWCNESLVVPPSFTGALKYHDQCRVDARRARYRIKTVRRQSKTAKPSRLSADKVFQLMGPNCALCNKPIDPSLLRTSRMGLTVDHKIPLSKGGEDTLDNMQPAHWICNVRKGNKTHA